MIKSAKVWMDVDHKVRGCSGSLLAPGDPPHPGRVDVPHDGGLLLRHLHRLLGAPGSQHLGDLVLAVPGSGGIVRLTSQGTKTLLLFI